MRLLRRLLLLTLLLPLLAACDGGMEETAVSLPNGPALIVFYTEN